MTILIYYGLCVLMGIMAAILNVRPTNWKWWIMMGCVIGAYFCGTRLA